MQVDPLRLATCRCLLKSYYLKDIDPLKNLTAIVNPWEKYIELQGIAIVAAAVDTCEQLC